MVWLGKNLVNKPHLIYVNKVRMDENLPAVNFTLFNAIGLAEAGSETTLFVQSKSADFTTDQLFQKFGLNSIENLTIKMLPEKRFFGIKTNQWFYFKVFSAIRKIHNANHPVTAVISRDPGALPFLVRLKKKTGIPVFYQPHNFYLDLSLQPDLNPKNAAKYHLLEKKFIPELTGLLCLQESQAGWFRKYLPSGFSVQSAMPGLVAIHQPEYAPEGTIPVIGYSGSLQLKKGMNTLLDAVSILKKKEIPFRLVLIGGRNDEEIKPVAERICALELDKEVEITGWIPFTEVEKHLKTLTVGVIPLTAVFYNQFLTAPNKFFDYLSYGIPVVASDLPSVRDFMSSGKEGLLAEPENAQALADALISLLTDKVLLTRFRENAQATATDFLWKRRGIIMTEKILSRVSKDPLIFS